MIGPALEMTGVSKTFAGVSALEDADLSIEAGEAHALMGANGAGKSTLMNILGGIVAAEGGEIRIVGRVASIASPRDARANGIAFVHQELALLASMSVAENVLIEDLPRRAGLIDTAAMIARTQPLLRSARMRVRSTRPRRKARHGRPADGRDRARARKQSEHSHL